MKKSVIVKGQKVQVEYGVYDQEEVARRDRVDSKRGFIFDREYNFSFMLDGKSYTVIHSHKQVNGSVSRKWWVENQWVTSEKKMIEAILNKKY